MKRKLTERVSLCCQADVVVVWYRDGSMTTRCLECGKACVEAVVSYPNVGTDAEHEEREQIRRDDSDCRIM
jgi:hypothetical protein